ncbi:MAG TPA: lysophospholipid acyltransferase family protein [Spirochaetota bacterium]|nr:lysophospholipid acyltransferase family protein [Spirochaetota bacterium]
MKLKYVIFSTPLVTGILYYISVVLLKITGWKLSGEFPSHKKFVLIGAPHTSNWDMAITFMAVFAYRKEIRWFGKKSIFRFPFNNLMKWMGGIPIDRSKRSNTVEAAAEFFQRFDSLVIALAPEGTRKKVKKWKTGFYYIALKAGVPIVFGFLDYKNKTAGIGPEIIPSGDFNADMKLILDFYRVIEGKHGHCIDPDE